MMLKGSQPDATGLGVDPKRRFQDRPAGPEEPTCDPAKESGGRTAVTVWSAPGIQINPHERRTRLRAQRNLMPEGMPAERAAAEFKRVPAPLAGIHQTVDIITKAARLGPAFSAVRLDAQLHPAV